MLYSFKNPGNDKLVSSFFASKEKVLKVEYRKKIEKIMAGMQCPKNFICVENGFEHLCSAKDFGLKKYLLCLEENPAACSFAFPFGNGHVCECPLRVYICKKLKR